jgi:hypothetical protein
VLKKERLNFEIIDQEERGFCTCTNPLYLKVRWFFVNTAARRNGEALKRDLRNLK